MSSEIPPLGEPISAMFCRQGLDNRECVTMGRSDQISLYRRVFSDTPKAFPSTGAGVDRPFISSLRPLQMGYIADAPYPTFQHLRNMSARHHRDFRSSDGRRQVEPVIGHEQRCRATDR
ncbi:hypothetical protein THAOC_27313 [Thalassiosira oceanica]|uniref:Uncharacterized protein n=1 Tax=Thalassiosira oceanica TaxID=159749 RepID=K0RLW4_THAOC|nr:hypothetical protein THAOC_27313 [Thalassiosira oceanica]|eukprot:EJK53279.1 hypothetical protein THAOC_27313 [Thalassiosira oceanica]